LFMPLLFAVIVPLAEPSDDPLYLVEATLLRIVGMEILIVLLHLNYFLQLRRRKRKMKWALALLSLGSDSDRRGSTTVR